MKSKHRISSYSFRPWIVSSLEQFPHIYVLWPLGFQIQKRIVSAYDLFYNTNIFSKKKKKLLKETTFYIFLELLLQNQKRSLKSSLNHTILTFTFNTRTWNWTENEWCKLKWSRSRTKMTDRVREIN